MNKAKRLFISMLTLLCCSTGAWAEGELNGLFTINASDDKVQFSQGNLQWSGTNGWRFASNQWDIIGSNANNTSPTSSNESYMDLFCWGATGLNGVAPNTEYSYLSGSSVLSGNNDWGTNMGASWRTLTSDEWAYLFNTRASGSTANGTSNARYAFATIRTDVNSGINGIILFPDGVNFAASEFTTLGTVNGVSSYATKCTSDQWTALEGKGCVFLPAAGFRSGSTVSYAGVHGSYWSSSPYASYEADKAYDVYFGNVLSLPRETQRFFGSSVRLVKDYELQQDGEGNYLLSSADDWKDFAAIVNSGTNPAANAKMTADIDLGDDQTMISDNVSYRYSGVFDGQGHKLNVNYYSSETTVDGGYYIAPFRDIQGATIKNLTVTGNITGYMHCAGVAGVAFSPSTNLISNVTVSANITILNTHGGGFIGHNENATTTIQDCLFNGTINGKSGGSTVGVFFGWSESSATMSLINCLENGSYTNYSPLTPTSCPGYAVPTVTNCYYTVSGSYPGTQATAAELADGTIAYKLQNNRGDLVWGQRIGTDTEPVLTNDENYRVYRSKNGGYTNSPEEAYEGIQQDGEGNYLLGCLSDWQDFAGIVNTNPAANAKMTADIDVGTDQTTIPTYRGIFDGQGHTLMVNLTATQDGYGPFLTLDGATIKNLHVTGTITNNSYSSFGGIVGYIGGTVPSTITNCRSSVTLKNNYSSSSPYLKIGGVVGGSSSTDNSYTTLDMSDCLFDGKFEGTNNSSSTWSGLVGWIYSATIKICNSLFAPASVDINGTLYSIYGKYNVFNERGSTFENLYTTMAGSSSTQATQATTAELSDGTTATALQNSRAEDVWVQDPLTNQPMLAVFAGKYTVPASGLGTFSAKAKFSVPDGLKAYYCRGYTDGQISAVAINGVVPANTGVLLKGTPGETYTLTRTTDDAATVTDNALVAVTEQTVIYQIVEINEVEYTNFGLSNGVFKKVNSKGGTVKANRAYLQIPSSALTPATAAEGIMLVWDEETDGIEIVQTSTVKSQHDDAWFTLDGRQLSGKPTAKGLYIVNGKKVIVK